MTDRELDLRLRAWYHADVPATETAPAALRASIAAIPRTGSGTVVRFPRRFLGLAAAATLLIGLLAATLLLTTGHAVIKPAPSTSSSLAPSAPLVFATSEPSTTPTTSAAPALLPIIYQTDGTTADIFTLDLASGQRTEVGTVGVDSVQLRSSTYARVRWSPDRTSAIIIRSTDGLLVQARVDVAARRIDTVGGAIQAISPDGTIGVRYDSDLVVLDFAGNVMRHLALTAGAGFQDPGPFSPDGTQVVMSGCKPCNASWRSHLYLVPLDGSPPRQLASAAGTGNFFIYQSWSPDASSIAVAHSGIAVIDVSSGALRQLTKDPTDASDEQPVWSNDGTRIAFARFNGAQRGLWVMDANGGNLKRLTTATDDGGDRLPVWSPDGSSLLFTRGPFDQFGDLWQVPSGGGTPELLVPNAIADW
jgi:Tol biopolymer transport system component